MTCPCGKPTRDNAYVCDTDRAQLAELLADLAWIDEQLEVTQTRQRGAATEGGPRSTETPLPFHDKASLARRHLHSVLRRWGCAIAPAGHAQRVAELALQENGYDALEQIEKAVKDARTVIFWKPPARVYLGRCEGRECKCECHGGPYACSDPETCSDPGVHGTPHAEECSGDVYAIEAEEVGTCRLCDRGYSVSIKRKAVEAELDDLLYTAAEIADLSSWLDLGVPRERVRKQIDSWHHRKRFAAKDEADGAPRFRYGDVKPLLYTYATRRENAS